MPSPGRITRLRVPHGPGVRDDGGVYEGDEVSIFYDPMISKFAVHGRTRNEALGRLRRALREYEIGGIKTTLQFFREVADDEEFIAGKLDTGFISRFNERRQVDRLDEVAGDIAIIAAAIAYSERKEIEKAAAVSVDSRPSRWRRAIGL